MLRTELLEIIASGENSGLSLNAMIFALSNWRLRLWPWRTFRG